MWFDASQVDPSTGNTQLPIGNHRVVLEDSSTVVVKDKTDKMLVFTVKIIDGQFNGVSGSYRLNLFNSNPQTTEIAAKQLSALAHVTNTPRLIDQHKMGSEMFGKPFRIVVTPQDDPKYTQVTAVMDDAGKPPTKGMFGSAAPQQQQPAQQFVPPGAQGGQPQFQPQQPQFQQPAQQPSMPPQFQQPQGGMPGMPGQGGYVPPQPQGAVQPQFQQPPQPQPGGAPQWTQQPGGAPTGQPGWVR